MGREVRLAHTLGSFATGAITTETLPSRRHMLAVALLAGLMTVLTVALPSSGGASGDSIVTTRVQYGD